MIVVKKKNSTESSTAACMIWSGEEGGKIARTGAALR